MTLNIDQHVKMLFRQVQYHHLHWATQINHLMHKIKNNSNTQTKTSRCRCSPCWHRCGPPPGLLMTAVHIRQTLNVRIVAIHARRPSSCPSQIYESSSLAHHDRTVTWGTVYSCSSGNWKVGQNCNIEGEANYILCKQI